MERIGFYKSGAQCLTESPPDLGLACAGNAHHDEEVRTGGGR